MHRFLSDLLLPSSIEFSSDAPGSSSLRAYNKAGSKPAENQYFVYILFDEFRAADLSFANISSAAIVRRNYLIFDIEYPRDYTLRLNSASM